MNVFPVIQIYILNELLNAVDMDSIYFFRTKTGTEIDFVIKRAKLLPIELKYKRLEKIPNTKAFTYFAAQDDIEKAYLVNLTLNRRVERETVRVEFIDFRRFLFNS